MEATNLTLRGEEATEFADSFVGTKVEEMKRSINRRGARNIHRYEGDGFTQIAYERAAPNVDDWVMVSIVVDVQDQHTLSVTVMIGGSGEGPFKIEETALAKLMEDDEFIGQAGRFNAVLRKIRRVCDGLELDVSVAWEGDREPTTAVEKLAGRLFESEE